MAPAALVLATHGKCWSCDVSATTIVGDLIGRRSRCRLLALPPEPYVKTICLVVAAAREKSQTACLTWKTLPSGSWPSQTLVPSNSHSRSTAAMAPPRSAALFRTMAISSTENTSLTGVSSRRSGGVEMSIEAAMCFGIRTITSHDDSPLRTANPSCTDWTSRHATAE